VQFLAVALEKGEGPLRGGQRILVVLDLGTDSAELEIVGDELEFVAEVGLQFVGGGGVRGGVRLGGQEGGDVVDDGLDVVGRTGQFPDPLVDAGLVVQRGDYEGALDGPSAPRCVLQDVFGLRQVDHGFVELLVADALAAQGVELLQLGEQAF
jgi:hypothetical protein